MKIKKGLSSIPIRNKVLMFGLLMSTIPLLLISLYYYSYIKIDLEERILDKQKLSLKVLSSEIELNFNETYQQVSAFKTARRNDNAFNELIHKNSSIEEIVVLNNDGFVEERTSRYKLNLPLEEELWITNSMRSSLAKVESRVYGEVEFNELGQPVMKMAFPYYEDGERKAIGVVLQLQKIIGEISSSRQDESNSYLYLIDQNNQVIAHQDYQQLWKQQQTLIDKDMIGVTEKLDELNWQLVMELPVKKAYEPINKILKNGLLVVLLFALVVSIISIYAGLYFTTPVVLLEKAMKKLKHGERSTYVELNRKDEFGKLATAFNEMSDELEEKSLRLEQEKERLDVVVNGIGAGFALVTREYEMTWSNPTLRTWLAEGELSLPCYSFKGGDISPCQACNIQCPDIDKQGEQVMTLDVEKASDKIFRQRVFPLSHTMREEGEFLLVIEDITEQKQMEEKMIQTDKLSALGIMASSFAHEVNNPLTIINVYAEDLIDRLEMEEIEEEEVKEYLGKIKENTVRCKQITSNLLNFSRKSNWVTSEINLQETIKSSVELVEYLLKKNDIKIKTSIEEALPAVYGDSLKFMQVLVNLLNNSIDALEVAGEIEVSAKMGRDFVVLKIADNGPGMTEEQIKNAFDPFYTTKPIGKGTGLGLSVCYGIIQQLGGEIYLNSSKGQGLTVKIRLPARKIKQEDVR